MSGVVLQMGHVDRTSGATGTTGEQALNRSVCDLAAAKLRAYGHQTRVILADEVYTGTADVFIAHHADGSDNKSASGASVGYPDKAGGALAHEFKVAYAARGWPHGWRADNYTPGLRGYYAYSRHPRIHRRMVIEAGFMTNPIKDRPWIDGHHGSIAQAIADAVNAVYGAPTTPPAPHPPTPEPEPPPPTVEVSLMSMKDNALVAAKIPDDDGNYHGYLLFVTEPYGQLVGWHCTTWGQLNHLARLLEIPEDPVGPDWLDVALIQLQDGPLANVPAPPPSLP